VHVKRHEAGVSLATCSECSVGVSACQAAPVGDRCAPGDAIGYPYLA
jgi:hypothetical protein